MSSEGRTASSMQRGQWLKGMKQKGLTRDNCFRKERGCAVYSQSPRRAALTSPGTMRTVEMFKQVRDSLDGFVSAEQELRRPTQETSC